METNLTMHHTNNSLDTNTDLFRSFFDALKIFEKIANQHFSKSQLQEIKNPNTKEFLRLFMLFKKKYNTDISSLVDNISNVNENDLLNLLEFLSRTIQETNDYEVQGFIQHMKNELEESLYHESIGNVNEEIKTKTIENIIHIQNQIKKFLEEKGIDFTSIEEDLDSKTYKLCKYVLENDNKKIVKLINEIFDMLGIKNDTVLQKNFLTIVNDFLQDQANSTNLEKTENLTVLRFIFVQISKSQIANSLEEAYKNIFKEDESLLNFSRQDYYSNQKKAIFLLNNPKKILSSSEKKSNILYVSNKENIYYKVFNNWDLALSFLKLNIFDVFKNQQTDKITLANKIKEGLDSKGVYSERLEFFAEDLGESCFFNLKISKKHDNNNGGELISIILTKDNSTKKTQNTKETTTTTANNLPQQTNEGEDFLDSSGVLRFESLEEGESTKQVAVMKISDFSIINKKYGVKLGNIILQRISKTIQNYVKKFNYLDAKKLSTLEFAIINKQNSSETIEDLFEEMLGAKNPTEGKFYIREIGEDIEIDFSCGIFNNEENLDVLEAFEKALMAMYHAKKNGSGAYYSPQIEQQEKSNIENYLNWKRVIRHALKQNNITPFLQGIYDAQDNNMLQYEALMRLYNTETGEICSPGQFLDYLPIFDKKHKAFMQVVIKAINFIKNDNRKKIFLNFTSEQLKNLQIYQIISNLLVSHKVKGENVTIEIPEETLEQNHDYIDKYKKLGIKIAIDDFGKGYSNLKKLFELSDKIDYLKVDGSIIRGIANDKSKQETLNLIMFFSKNHDFQIIVEFIETQEDYQYLKNLGVRYFQGFLFSKPKPIEQRFIQN
ncbi:GGDEF domain-containing phosphodiesterase [Candidatus Absconditicoccus praedator]|uniref:GGDEF domain-containing phosphodiesterase n=1 Tax=Candidatus Absconditicoccus praedator TaxID=2735562 RepID=UPI001E44C8FC|nr:GGDEF domain-containing phosphodiesterase [Candidatus Absconditicoccus praedator]UFX82905.1 EAL domain-containing protein [Candidatus Absconditicoccus praedator]